MGLYKESRERLKFTLKNENNVELSVSCLPGMRVNSTVNLNEIQLWNGETKSIGKAADLKDKRVRIISVTEDRTGQGIGMKFTFSQKNGERNTYEFPADFEGTPEFDTNDALPTFYLYINFY